MWNGRNAIKLTSMTKVHDKRNRVNLDLNDFSVNNNPIPMPQTANSAYAGKSHVLIAHNDPRTIDSAIRLGNTAQYLYNFSIETVFSVNPIVNNVTGIAITCGWRSANKKLKYGNSVICGETDPTIDEELLVNSGIILLLRQKSKSVNVPPNTTLDHPT